MVKFRTILSYAVLALLSSFCNAQITPAQDDTPIKVSTVLLNVPVMVSDRGSRNFSGLQKSDFQILIDGKEQEISYFSDSEGPMTVAILIDTSGSIGYHLTKIIRDANLFVRQLTPNDEGMVMTFGAEIAVLQKLTNKPERIRSGIKAADRADGGSALMNDALIRVVNKEFAGRKGRKAVIVLTDGGEVDLRTWDLLRDTLIESDVVVYPIFYHTFPIIPSKKNARFLAREWEGKVITMNDLVKIPPVTYLHALAVVTGGRVYAAEASNFGNAFQQISDELRKQYVLGFYPDNGTVSSNNIKISVKRDGAIVRTKSNIRLKPPPPEPKK